MNMLRHIALAAALLALGAETAWSACPGQTGKPIFSDDFSDESGGWEVNTNERYVPGAFQIRVPPQSRGFVSENQTFTATDADYCAVATFPSDPPEPGNKDFVSITFLGSDYSNLFELIAYSDGTATIYKLQPNKWTSLFDITKIKSINTEPGAENTLRVIIKDQKMTFFVNGAQIKVVRAQTPDGANRFGFSAGTMNPVTKERVFSIKSYSVTEAP